MRDWLIIRLALFSGLRASEICALQITDCHIGYAHSDLLVRRGKGNKMRVVKIGPDLKKDIRWYLRWKAQVGELHPDAYLLRTKRAERLNRSALWRRWNRYCPSHRLHDARHTAATLLYEASQDLRLVQKQLGHSRPSITAVYADVCDVKAREGVAAMEQLAKRTMRVGGSTPATEPMLSSAPAEVAAGI
ncbi:MAG: Tyrosine recombinase XerC [Verrucomicrobiae bacterium]|nr:Tyrosine recombinase XerC [Verrucomicrobiae bacterium]